jgi:tetratricopeptide (TPR) repeat protein
MHTNCFDRRSGILGVAFLAVLLLSDSYARGQVAPSPKTEDEKPPQSSRKAEDEDPPLPSRKLAPDRELRVQVTAASAEVQAGDKVIATVTRGDMLRFLKKTDEYYLVLVNDKKGWIAREAVREVQVRVGGPEGAIVEVPVGPAPAVIDKEAAARVQRATAFLRVRLANGNTVEGSGFFAVQPGLLLTNAHVLGMRSPGSSLPAEVNVVVHSGEPDEFTLPAEVLGVDRDNDLGVLRVKERPGRLPLPLAVDTSRDLGLVQKVYVFGFPFGTSLGKDITASESSVSSIRKDAGGFATQIQVNGGMQPGNSGGPVVDSRGVAVGVAVSIIRGTQINFAVPGDRVQELLRGRALAPTFGEAFLEKDQTKVPVRLNCLDPLQRIRTVQLAVWTGKPGSSRPPSPTEPKAIPGDGTRQSLAVSYQDGAGQVDVALPELAEGEVVWVQPVLTSTDGAVHWGGAVALNRPDLPPLVRRVALLQPSVERHNQRTLKLTSAHEWQVSKAFKQTLFRENMEVEALETAQKEPRGGRFDLSFGACKFTTTDLDGKDNPTYPRTQNALRDRSLTFILDPQGSMRQRTIPVLPPQFPPDLRADFTELVHDVSNAYEMTCLPVLDRQLKAQETWQAVVPLFLSVQNKKQTLEMHLTCTYEGRRIHGGQEYAVISLAGKLKSQEAGPSSVGIVTGKVHFALDGGYVSQANLKVESQLGNGDSTIAHSLTISLTRVPGNAGGIVARPLQPIPPGTDYELAVPFLKKRDFERAIPLLEKAVAANPRLVQAQADLGFAYNEKGLYDKTIPCLQKVLEIEPRHVSATNNLGYAYHALGQDDQAIPLLRKVVELDPKHVIGYDNLARALTEAGELEQACEALKKLVALTPETAPQFRARKQTLEHTETLLQLERSLPEILKGERKAGNFQEILQFVKVCRLKQHYAAAVRFFEQGLTTDPEAAKKMPPTNLVILAQTAILASAGKGSDPLPEADRAKYRAKALAWLRQFVKVQQEALEKDFNANRYTCQRSVRVLLHQKKLASVRQPALQDLPADERKDWEAFWTEVSTLLEKADALTP